MKITVKGREVKIMTQGREIEILDKADLTGNIFKVRFKDTNETKNVHSKFIKFVEEEKEENIKDEVELEMAELSVEIASLLVKAKNIEMKCKSGKIVDMIESFNGMLEMNCKMSDIMIKQHKLLEKAAENLK